MTDLLTLIASHTGAADSSLRGEAAAHIAAVRASAGRGNRSWVAAAEKAIRSNSGRGLSIDTDGLANIAVDGHTWSAGRFETCPIAMLRDRCVANARTGVNGRLRLSVLDGASPATDIGTLQATSSESTLFQVASQFNCLESPGPWVTPVADYFSDPTQGPRASISAFAATLLRHYAAPHIDGSRFVQKTAGPQIDLLADALGPGACQDGYFTGEGREPQAVLRALHEHFDLIRVGVHDNAQVALGYNWDGGVDDSPSRRIAQVFTSTVAGGAYGGDATLGKAFQPVCRQLLRAAYLGTLLAAVSLGRRRIVLTLIGGGVFGNPVSLILEAIEWAANEIESMLIADLTVIVNGYNLGSMVDLQADVLPIVRHRGGAIVQFNQSGVVEVLR